MSALEVAKLTKTFGAVTVLDELDLTAPEGELTALIGRSGCGKTTLLRIVAGFDRPDAGTVTIAGRTLASPGGGVPPERRRIGYVTQEGNLFPHLTVAGNVAFGLARRDRKAGSSIGELLELVGLDHRYARRHPHQLSGGEQQRVALARALATRPDVVLLDEPFSALDAELRTETRLAVTSALAATATTTVLVTHDQGEAMSLARQVAVMRGGVIVQAGAPEEVYRRPADHAVAAFVGEVTTIPATLNGQTAGTALGHIALPHPAHGPGAVLVRPEQIVIGEPGSSGFVPAKAVAIDFRGHDGLVQLVIATEEAGRQVNELTVTARSAGQLLPAAGQQVGVRLTGTALAVTP